MKAKAILFYAAALLILGGVFAWLIFISRDSGGPSGDELLPSQVMARVDGVDITAEEVNRFINLAGMAAEADRELQRDALNALINRRVLEHEGARRGVVVTDDELQASVNDFVESRGGEESALELLAERNLSLEDIKESIRWDMFIERLEQAVVEEFKGNVTVSDEDVKQFYEENKTSGRITRMEIDFLFFTVREEEEDGLEAALKRAEEVIEELDNGVSFEELRERFRNNPESRVRVGKFSESDQVSELLWTEALKLEVGDHSSEPIEFFNGFQILQCLSRRIVPLDDVEEEIREHLRIEMLRTSVNEFFQGLRDKADVEIFFK